MNERTPEGRTKKDVIVEDVHKSNAICDIKRIYMSNGLKNSFRVVLQYINDVERLQSTLNTVTESRVLIVK
jgi:hypothetical protein